MAAALDIAPGLECLSQLATVMVHQTTRGYDGNNYSVLGAGEELLFTLNENVPDTFFRGGKSRSFIFDGVDKTGRKICSFRRPDGGLFIKFKVELFLNNELFSIIRLEKNFITPVYSIHDAKNNLIMRLKGAALQAAFFELQTNTKTPIGGLQKTSRGWRDDMFSLKDDYIISFPVDLAVQYKLAVIVACVYIDFTYHEGK